MTKPKKHSISTYKFLEAQRIKRKVQKYFDPLGRGDLKGEFFKEVCIHDVINDNFPEETTYNGRLPSAWIKIKHLAVDYQHITFGLGSSFVYVSPSGVWQSALFFGFEYPKGWQEAGVWIEADLRYEDIKLFDTRLTKSNWHLPHVYTDFQYSGTPFYQIRYKLALDTPKGLHLDPAKQIIPYVPGSPVANVDWPPRPPNALSNWVP